MSKTSAKVIAVTRHPVVPSAVITTFEVYAPRFLLAEINTHRVLAKSAASSRAIPVKKRIEMVKDHGFMPTAFGKNKPGMQATERIEGISAEVAETTWRGAMMDAVARAEQMNATAVHKQHANRLLEPFAYYHGVVTATEWDNFFALRLHPDAQPEFQELARKMKDAMDAATPVVSKWHLPYMDDMDWSPFSDRELFDVSGARCARVSYQTHDGKPFSLEADQRRVQELIKGGHMSPFDHAAVADTVEWWKSSGRTTGVWDKPGDHRQFWGWIPDRVEVERIAGIKPGRRDSYAEFDS